MSIGYIDLHIHTTASDGSISPVEIAVLAQRRKLKAIAITDHDSIEGLVDLKDRFHSNEIEIISGIELSVEYEEEMHLLGYFIDINSKELIQDIRKIKSMRFSEVRDFFLNLSSFNINISPNEVVQAYGNLSKRSIAMYLVDTGYAKNICDAYKLFTHKLNSKKKHILSPYEGINIIKKAGGICFLAHPNSLRKSREELEVIIDDLVAHGLNGIECYHSQCTTEKQNMYLEIAKERGLLISGGSDFHGKIKPEIELGCGYGDLMIPYEILERMKTFNHGVF